VPTRAAPTGALRNPSHFSRSRTHSLLVLRDCHTRNTFVSVKTITVRLPDSIVADIDAESRERGVSKSDIVRERLQHAPRGERRSSALNEIADLIGSVDTLPEDLSARKRDHLKTTGYGRKRRR